MVVEESADFYEASDEPKDNPNDSYQINFSVFWWIKNNIIWWPIFSVGEVWTVGAV